MGFLHTRITNPRPTGCSYGWFPNGLHLNGHQSVDVAFDPFTTIPVNSGYLPMLIQQLRQGMVKFEYWVEEPCTFIQNPRARKVAPPTTKTQAAPAPKPSIPVVEKKVIPPSEMPPVQVGAPIGVVPKPPVVEVSQEPVKETPVVSAPTTTKEPIKETPVASAPPMVKVAEEPSMEQPLEEAPAVSKATVKEEPAVEETKADIPAEFNGISRRSRRRR